ncbi:hypothetical protein I545_6272, partial [Mycobacterium kansasii 662]
MALNKFADAVAAECRRVGIADAHCALPLAHKVTQAARDAYLQSWVHRTAQFQYALADPLPISQAQWLGTHNSFNSLSDSFTLSHGDSNQQLSLAQQLDIDVRGLELDLHYLPRLELLGKREVTVCHGLAPTNGNLGCTNEPPLTAVLPQIKNWLNIPGHTDEVILLYLEDELRAATAYSSALATLEDTLRRPDGQSLIYHPDRPAAPPTAVSRCRCRRHAMTSRRGRASRARQFLHTELVGRRLHLEGPGGGERLDAGLPAIPHLRRHVWQRTCTQQSSSATTRTPRWLSALTKPTPATRQPGGADTGEGA